jgi:hypothetical protein
MAASILTFATAVDIALQVTLEAGLGEARKQLRIKSFLAAWGDDGPTVHSATLAKVHLRRASREDVLEYFHNTWQLTDTLFDALRDDSAFYAKPDKLRRPLIFYFAHPAAVYANKMHLAGLMGESPRRSRCRRCRRRRRCRCRQCRVGVPPLPASVVASLARGRIMLPAVASPSSAVVADLVDPFLQKLFETGVDEMSWDDMDELQNDDFPWPSVADAHAFRLKVRRGAVCGVFPVCAAVVAVTVACVARALTAVTQVGARVCACCGAQCKAAVEAVIKTMTPPSECEVTMDSPLWALFMGFEHERIHLETSSVLFRQVRLSRASLSLRVVLPFM